MHKGKISRLAVATMLATGVLAFAKPPVASATTLTLSGAAVCTSGRSVVGIWVESSAGGSGWAGFTPAPSKPYVAYYSKSVAFSAASSSVTVTVGCGGSPASWASSSRSGAMTLSSTHIYNTWCTDPSTGNGSCQGPSVPNGQTRNVFPSGQCTWGAAEMWRKATGKYPAWVGDGNGSANAKYWNDLAKSLGYRVTTVPMKRSIWVRESGGGGAGHVGWVYDVWVSGGQTYFKVRHMNANWDGQWSDSTITFVPGDHTFIVAARGAPVTR